MMISTWEGEKFMLNAIHMFTPYEDTDNEYNENSKKYNGSNSHNSRQSNIGNTICIHTHTLYICGVMHTYCIWTCVDAHTDMHIPAHAHTCIQACMHMYTHAQTHTHTHTHTHTEPHTHAFSSPMSHINPLVYMTVKWILDFTHTHTHTHMQSF